MIGERRGGKQWAVIDEDHLATLAALVLIGCAHAESVLAGTQRTVTLVPNALKEQLRRQLQTAACPPEYHRDGLLVEIISWPSCGDHPGRWRNLCATPAWAASVLRSDRRLGPLRGYRFFDTLQIGVDHRQRNCGRHFHVFLPPFGVGAGRCRPRATRKPTV